MLCYEVHTFQEIWFPTRIHHWGLRHSWGENRAQNPWRDSAKWRRMGLPVPGVVRRATSTTLAIRRMKALGVSEVKLTVFWKSEGRVHLEYACPVWHSSLTAAQSKSLDRAQQVAMAAITGGWLPSHTQQLLDLGLDRLGPRRDLLCKRFAERTARDSRHTDLFNSI